MSYQWTAAIREYEASIDRAVEAAVEAAINEAVRKERARCLQIVQRQIELLPPYDAHYWELEDTRIFRALEEVVRLIEGEE